MAQQQPGQGQGGQGQGGQGQGGFQGQGQGGGRRGNQDPAAQLQFTLDNIQQALGASDQEWTVLKPKVQKVVSARQEVQAGQRGGRGGGGGRRGGGGGAPGGNNPTADTAVARALLELQTTLDNTNSTPDQISQRLAALRDAKARAASNLLGAQKELKDLLTARQEAVLVTMNYLE